jgi:hypothetical protein
MPDTLLVSFNYWKCLIHEISLSLDFVAFCWFIHAILCKGQVFQNVRRAYYWTLPFHCWNCKVFFGWGWFPPFFSVWTLSLFLYSGLEISEALKLQMEVQKRLHEQLEVSLFWKFHARPVILKICHSKCLSACILILNVCKEICKYL